MTETRVTMAMIAQEAGCTATEVGRAFGLYPQQHRQMSPTRAAQIRAVAERMGFRRRDRTYTRGGR